MSGGKGALAMQIWVIIGEPTLHNRTAPFNNCFEAFTWLPIEMKIISIPNPDRMWVTRNATPFVAGWQTLLVPYSNKYEKASVLQGV